MLAFLWIVSVLALSFFLIRNIQTIKTIKRNFVSLMAVCLDLITKQDHLENEFAQARGELIAQLSLDGLTGLSNRQVVEDRLEQTVKQSKRHHLLFAVLVLSIDEFHVINDVLGHDVGDAILIEVAKRLQLCVRQVDTLGRFSADQFVIVLTQLSKVDTIVYIAQRLLQSIAEPFKVHDENLFITASIGIAVYPTDGEEGKILLKNATHALTRAKERSRNTHQFYQDTMHARSERELILSSHLRSPQVTQEFSLYFQPVIQVADEHILGVQSVLYWQPTNFAALVPEEFSRLVDQSGKSLEIGEWMLRHALTQFSEWRHQFPHLKYTMVPLSLRQLSSSHFIYKISQLLQELDIAPGDVVIEVTGESLLTGFEQTQKAFNMLKHMGVSVALCALGASHLSLEILKSLSIQYLKIQDVFIKDITTNPEKIDFLKLILALSKHLNITVIPEGVESSAQKKLLTELGCTIMQGPLFSPFLLGQQMTKKLEEVGV